MYLKKINLDIEHFHNSKKNVKNHLNSFLFHTNKAYLQQYLHYHALASFSLIKFRSFIIIADKHTEVFFEVNRQFLALQLKFIKHTKYLSPRYSNILH